jgi:hypothetical protein
MDCLQDVRAYASLGCCLTWMDHPCMRRWADVPPSSSVRRHGESEDVRTDVCCAACPRMRGRKRTNWAHTTCRICLRSHLTAYSIVIVFILDTEREHRCSGGGMLRSPQGHGCRRCASRISQGPMRDDPFFREVVLRHARGRRPRQGRRSKWGHLPRVAHIPSPPRSTSGVLAAQTWWPGQATTGQPVHDKVSGGQHACPRVHLGSCRHAGEKAMRRPGWSAHGHPDVGGIAACCTAGDDG